MIVYQRSGFLSPEECEEIICSFPQPEPAAVNVSESAAALKVVRQSKASFGKADWLSERLHAALVNINSRFYKFDIDNNEPLQLAQYDVGDGYGDHLDIGPGTASHRKLSVSIQLSRPHDYDGGDLVVWGSGTCESGIGDLIAFPSFLVHRVEPVTRGRRYSLVMWATGELGFR